MAADDISVSIGVQGESAFKKALTECQNSVKQLDSALKANAAEYENNADALGENVERAKLLKQAIETQKKMAEGLGDAVKYASEKYGEASSQTTKYVVAQNKAKEAVAKLEKELKDTDREMEELGRDSRTVGQQLERGIGDGAEDAARKLGNMMDDIKDELEGIGQSVGITATIDVVKNVMDGIENLTEETKEYRQQVSYLQQNTKDAGQAWADVESHLFRVTANTGSLEDATEGISNLLAAGLDSAEVADAVNLLLGAVVKFPQTYKFEALAESLRNTVEEKKAVGAYSELLTNLGVDLETFNKALEKTTSKEAAQDLVLSFGANRGLESTIAEYEKANELMLNANTKMLEYQAGLATLAEQMTPIGTAWTEMQTAAIGAVTALLEDTQVDEWVTGKINDITEIIRLIATAEGRAELTRRATEGMGETIGVEDIDIDTAIERQKRAIEEAKMWGDYSTLYTAEQTLKELEAAKEAGKTTGEALMQGVTETIQASEEALKNEGENAMVEVANGVTEGGQAAVDNTAAVISDMQTSFNSLDTSGAIQQLNSFYNAAGGSGTLPKGWNLGSGGSGLQESGNPALQVSMNIDGTTFARVTAPYTSAALGRITEMTA